MLEKLARPGPAVPPLRPLAGPQAQRRLGEVGLEVVGGTAPSSSRLVIRRAKGGMDQLLGVLPGPHPLALPPHPSVRAWVGQPLLMLLEKPLGLEGLGARRIPLVSPKGCWDLKPMGRGLEGVKHRT